VISGRESTHPLWVTAHGPTHLMPAFRLATFSECRSKAETERGRWLFASSLSYKLGQRGKTRIDERWRLILESDPTTPIRPVASLATVT